MAFNATYDAAATDDKVQRIGAGIASIRASAVLMLSGTMTAYQMIRIMQGMDGVYSDIQPLWASAEIAAIRTAAENTAIAEVKVALDDLVLSFADLVETAGMSSVIDNGSGYNSADSRAVRLSNVNRSFTHKTITIPATITAAASDLVTAIDAFRAA